jgi:hypothetical protein
MSSIMGEGGVVGWYKNEMTCENKMPLFPSFPPSVPPFLPHLVLSISLKHMSMSDIKRHKARRKT